VAAHVASASVLFAVLFLCDPRPFTESAQSGRASTALPIAELWSDPIDLERVDLSKGRWAGDRAPDPRDTFVFLKAKRHGSSPGMQVMDGRKRIWHVKQGREAQPEVVMSRVLSALGYHQPPVYYLPSFTVVDGSGSHLAAGGRFRQADSSLRDCGEWKWEENPFVGSRPYRALLVILVLLNSADLKNSNNTVYELATPGGDAVRRWYVVRDLGTSLGGVGRFDPTPNDAAVFERRRFVTRIKDGYVEFGDYRAVHNELVLHSITPDDVRWATGLLGRLSERQWFDAFLGAGYPPAIADRFVRRIRQKIDEGNTLGRSQSRMLGPVQP
jgi:hypothetical protein